MSSLTGAIVNFKGFYKEIEEAIDLNSIYATRMICEADKPYLIPELVTWLVKRTGHIGIQGYAKEGLLGTLFDKEVMEEFDQLYLDFRDYLRDEKGIDPDQPMTLLRHVDMETFIPLTGVRNDTFSDSQCYPFGFHFEQMGDSADPFLPSGRWVYTES